MNIALFLVSILLVFIGCDLFTNGIEWIGHKFKLSESVVGSILAAIGTALPETIHTHHRHFFHRRRERARRGIGRNPRRPLYAKHLSDVCDRRSNPPLS